MELRAKVGPKGQAVIPKPIRDKLGIQPGDDVAFTLHDEHAHVEKAGARTDEAWRDLFASVPPERRIALTIEDIKRWQDEAYR